MSEFSDLPPAEAPSPSALHLARERFSYVIALLDLRGRGLALLCSLILIAWVMAGIYMVQPDEQGVVLRFGKWVETTEPGLHYHLPYPIETVRLPKVTKVNQLKLGGSASLSFSGHDALENQMLTGDENIVEAYCTLVWRIKDAGLYLFGIDDPERSLRIAAESALREIISRTPIQGAMSDQRALIADQTRELLQQLLDHTHTGILVTQVQLQQVDPPTQVIDAFNDVQRARADKERTRNEADAYDNDIIPRARGDASRIAQEADAYKSQVINLAEGEARHFQSIDASYAKARNVTAWRLYLEGMDQVLKNASKVIIDSSGKGMSSVVPYMPIPNQEKTSTKAVTQKGSNP